MKGLRHCGMLQGPMAYHKVIEGLGAGLHSEDHHVDHDSSAGRKYDVAGHQFLDDLHEVRAGQGRQNVQQNLPGKYSIFNSFKKIEIWTN